MAKQRLPRKQGGSESANWPGKPAKGAMLKAFEAVMAGPATDKDSELVKMVRQWRETDATKFLAEYQKAEQQYAKRLEGWEAMERERARDRKNASNARKRGADVEPDAGSVKVYDVIQRLLKREGIESSPVAPTGAV